ncbi:MAG: phosphate transport regulator [Burkholderiales bacterium]|nr:phosphate transport regulator [Burkholderiales bacterium]
MDKEQVLAALGPSSLLRPAAVREALRANDRLKLALGLLQAAAQHAQAPGAAVDLSREIAATDMGVLEDARWLRELPNLAETEPGGIHLPGLERLRARMKADLALLAAPLEGEAAAAHRVADWRERLGRAGEHLSWQELDALAAVHREGSDTLHQLVMDLHKALNKLASSLSGHDLSGAHAWQLAPDGSDVPLVEAFMRGLHRTAAAKLDHPGLDTSATRDGDTLLIQNDIGTNDAHVLVLQVRDLGITLTYSDLHRRRFAWFQQALAALGASWGEVHAREAPTLNAGKAFQVGVASFQAPDRAVLCTQLEGVAARIVFLIDWNRARKQLVQLVGKQVAAQVLESAAQAGCGHVAWLQAGGARLVWDAMAAQSDTGFRLGERLDDVLTAEAAGDFLAAVLDLAWKSMQAGQPALMVGDEVRLLLARTLAGRRRGFELLQEHAALCHALASALHEGILHDVLHDTKHARRLALRARDWEHQADAVVSRCREEAARAPRWQPVALLLQTADDIADALEEAAFGLGALAECGARGWTRAVSDPLQALAAAVLDAVQDHVRAVEVAAHLEPGSAVQEQQEYLDTLWRVQQGERTCDQLHRAFRVAAARELDHAASLQLGNEIASALELASDAVLSFAWRLREQALRSAAGATR